MLMYGKLPNIYPNIELMTVNRERDIERYREREKEGIEVAPTSMENNNLQCIGLLTIAVYVLNVRNLFFFFLFAFWRLSFSVIIINV